MAKLNTNQLINVVLAEYARTLPTHQTLKREIKKINKDTADEVIKELHIRAVQLLLDSSFIIDLLTPTLAKINLDILSIGGSQYDNILSCHRDTCNQLLTNTRSLVFSLSEVVKSLRYLLKPYDREQGLS